MHRSWSTDKVQKAWEIATHYHKGQQYGGGTKGEGVEYISHIRSVVFEVMNACIYTPKMDGELTLLCAILHDTLEDTTYTYQQLEKDFGTAVASGVLALTKNKKLRGKEQQLLDSLDRIKQQPTEIWAVKMADRVSNLNSSPHHWDKKRKEQYLMGAERIYQSLAAGNEYIAARLAYKIKAYTQFI